MGTAAIFDVSSAWTGHEAGVVGAGRVHVQPHYLGRGSTDRRSVFLRQAKTTSQP